MIMTDTSSALEWLQQQKGWNIEPWLADKEGFPDKGVIVATHRNKTCPTCKRLESRSIGRGRSVLEAIRELRNAIERGL